MPGEDWTQTPEEWQDLLTRLLSLKYGPRDFTPIPDTVRGDCGLEGFTRSGIGFQCYAPENSQSVQDLTRKQKAKITSDVPKIIKYQATLKEILGPTVLDRWILVVPRWEDKSLLAHAEKKMQLLRGACISFISPTIAPNIITGEDFIVERQQLMRAGRESLRIPSSPVDQGKMEDWISENDDLVANLFRKVLAIQRQDMEEARQLRDEYIRHYLEGQNALLKLRQEYPDIFEDVDRIKKDKEHFLVTESLTTPELPPNHLKTTLESFEADLTTTLRGLDKFTVKRFCHEAIADWLLRCPLNFRNSLLRGAPLGKH